MTELLLNFKSKTPQIYTSEWVKHTTVWIDNTSQLATFEFNHPRLLIR